MPIDPDIKQLLEKMAEAGEIDPNTVSAQAFRQLTDSANLAMKSEVIEIGETKDFEIPVDGATIRARLYSNGGEKTLILYYHGGGFVFGNIETHDSVCRLLARESGSKVLSVDYRLAPEFKFPTAPMDSYSAYLWALENASKLGVESSRIAVCGDSAGGNISAVISVKTRDDKKPIPKLQALFYPVLGVDVSSQSHRDYSEGYFLTGVIMNWCMKQYMPSLAELANNYFSVQTVADLSGLPETLVFTAEFDPLRDQGETFVTKLRAAGVKATGIRTVGMIHGYVSFFEFSGAARNSFTMAAKMIGDKLRN